MTRVTINKESRNPEQIRQQPYVIPVVDIYENNDEILLIADMPGVNKDHLAVELNDEHLTIEGKRPVLAGFAAEDWKLPDFRRSFTLRQRVDFDHVRAHLDQGVLTIHLPKSPEVKTRQISIQSF